ncbi:hypothetical protein PRIPAC_94997 [Pristionchus pacificus]|nr:hypothetical protein PRIPAC_94997 [Pristionchus pacificus]|eukprot:PDM62757.1 hypothetical protein PRIPAC_49972 [Pristionchus pacificus]
MAKVADDFGRQAGTVKLGDTLELVLLLDGVAVGGFLGGVDQLVGQALSDRLDIYNTSWRFHFPKSLTSGRSLSSSKAGATSTASLTSLAAHSSAMFG